MAIMSSSLTSQVVHASCEEQLFLGIYRIPRNIGGLKLGDFIPYRALKNIGGNIVWRRSHASVLRLLLR